MLDDKFARPRFWSGKGRISSPCVGIRGSAGTAFVRGPEMTKPRLKEQAAVLALIEKTELKWNQMALLIEQAGSALKLVHRDWNGLETFDVLDVEQHTGPVTESDLERAEQIIVSSKAQLVTVLDEEYPANLRLVYDRPPFLFARGKVKTGDDRAVAIVGTRTASERGTEMASNLAKELVQRGVTVLSGLALGIDGAAHGGTLAAGGRTIGVMGAGIDAPIYPEMHADLAEEIVESGGALVSQFWPWAAPTRYSFPLRNRTMSGMALGTVVIEAGQTSGARQQARIATEHGKQVFLVESLVLQEAWAQKLADHPATRVVKSVDDIVGALDLATSVTEQMSLR